MRSEVLRTLQVGILTVMLVFGGLLVVNNFDTTAWSDDHHIEKSGEAHIHYPFTYGFGMVYWYLKVEYTRYDNSGKGHHDDS